MAARFFFMELLKLGQWIAIKVSNRAVLPHNTRAVIT
jgi:hypothetical protein